MATVRNSLILRLLSFHNGVMLRCQREIQRSRNLKQWWQQWTSLTCLDFQRPFTGVTIDAVKRPSDTGNVIHGGGHVNVCTCK